MSQAANDPLECLSAKQVAEKLGISKAQVYALARRGQLPHVRLGISGVVFPRVQLERHLAGSAERSVSIDSFEDGRRRRSWRSQARDRRRA